MVAAAIRAEAWAGEPFLRDGEDPAEVLAPGTARRHALDEALAEIEAGRKVPSPQWKVRFGLMLGLERVLAEPEPHDRAPAPKLRRHQVDALAGMLTELISASQRDEEANANGNGHLSAAEELAEEEAEDDDEDELSAGADDEDGDEELDELLPAAGPRRGAPLPLPPSDRVRQDDRRRRLRRGGAHARHPDPHPPPAARLPVPARPHHRGLRRPLHRRDRGAARSRSAATRSRSRRTPGSRATSTRSAADAYQLVICDEAHTALGEKTSAAIRSFPEPIYIGMTATEQLIAKQVSDVFPASVDDLPLQDAARRGLIAPLRCLRVPPVAAINSVPIVGGDFDQEILAKTLDHQALNQAAASLYRDRFDNTPGHRLRGRRRPRVQPRPGVPRRRPEGRGGLRPDAAGAPRRDARRVRARRDQRPDQRAAARRGLELAARDGLHAPRADRVAPRLPAADRADHADAPAQGGGDRRRLRPEGRDPQRARRLAALAPRRGLLPRGRPRHPGAAPPLAAPRPPQPHAGAVARPGHAGRPPPDRRHPARVAADRPALPRRRRAALLGDDRRPPDPLRRARDVRPEAHRGAREQGRARAVPRHVRRREPEPAPADDGAAGPRLDARRARRLRRPRHARDAGADVGEGAAGRDPHAPARDLGGQARRARPDPRPLDVAARPGDPQGAGSPRLERVPGGEAPARRARELARAPARGERGEARPHRARAAAPGRRGAARVRGGLHAARDEAARRGARAARRDPGGRARALREPARTEAAGDPEPPPAAAQEEGRHPGAGAGSGRGAGRRRRSSLRPRPTAGERRDRRRPSLPPTATRRSRSAAARAAASRRRPTARPPTARRDGKAPHSRTERLRASRARGASEQQASCGSRAGRGPYEAGPSGPSPPASSCSSRSRR